MQPKPNWDHTCVGNACCELMLVVGKLDIYYAKAIKCYLLRRDHETAEKFKSISKMLDAAHENPEAYPGIEAAIAMGALDRTSST